MTYEEFKEKVGSVILTGEGNCPVTPAVQMLQGKWKLQILYELCIKCPMRFGELKKMLKPITNTALTNALKELEADDLIQRIQYNDMMVLDNVKVGLHNQIRYNMWTGILRLPAYKEKEHEMNREAMKLLKIFDLDKEADYKASQLPYGKQRKLEIARALATNPKLLLLDEPAAGMNPNETEELMHTIHSVRDQFGVAILLIEHDMNFVMGICEEITVLDYGRVIARGDGKAIRNNPKVIAAYLGGD